MYIFHSNNWVIFAEGGVIIFFISVPLHLNKEFILNFAFIEDRIY